MPTTSNRHLTRQAYLDDQLALEEVIAFEEALSPAERAEIEAERQFEEAMAERLAKPAPCPTALWDRIDKQVREQPTGRTWLTLLPTRRRLLAVAAALAMVFVVAAVVHNGGAPGNESQVNTMLPKDSGTCASMAEIPGDFHKVSGALTANRIFLNFQEPDPAAHHPIRLLGMRMLKHEHSEVAQVFFECCGRPVTIYIVPRTGAFSAGDLPMRDAHGDWKIQQREVDQYRIVAVGTHDLAEVLRLFS